LSHVVLNRSIVRRKTAIGEYI